MRGKRLATILSVASLAMCLSVMPVQAGEIDTVDAVAQDSVETAEAVSEETVVDEVQETVSADEFELISSEEYVEAVNDSTLNATVLTAGQTKVDAIDSTKKALYYKYTTTGNGYFTVSFGLDSTVDVKYGWDISILDRASNTIKTYYNVKSSIESGEMPYAANQTLYIKIAPSSYSSEPVGIKYKLTVKHTESNVWEKENNDTSANATKIATNTTYYGTSVANGDDDYYRVDASGKGGLKLSFSLNNLDEVSSVSYGWDVSLLDSNGKIIKKYNNVKSGIQSADIPYSAGVYFVYIVPDYSYYTPLDVVYTIRVDEYELPGWESEINNDTSSANGLQIGETKYGNLHKNDDIDYFKIELPSGSYSLTAGAESVDTVSSVGYGWNVYLLNSDNKTVISIDEAKGQKTSKSVLLDGGTYYVKMTPRWTGEFPEDVTYVVRVNKTGVPDGYFATFNNYYFYKEGSDVRCYASDGTMVKNDFKCDGTYTYFFQNDGTAMKDRLTYHPDGVHVIYFDSDGHEVFSDFANVRKSISGESVNDYCFFNVYGYLYVDVVTYDKTGTKLYYANAYGVLERGKWFQFSPYVKCADGTDWAGAAGNYGYAYSDGTLAVNVKKTDWMGRKCYMQGNGVAQY